MGLKGRWLIALAALAVTLALVPYMDASHRSDQPRPPHAATPVPAVEPPPVAVPAQVKSQSCSVDQLSVTNIEDPEGSVAHRYFKILFTNRGGPCLMQGYPELTGLDDSGQAVTRAQRRSAGTEATLVRLDHGQAASAQYQGLLSLYKACPKYVAITVTPPNAEKTARIAWNSDPWFCDFAIQPVAPDKPNG